MIVADSLGKVFAGPGGGVVAVDSVSFSAHPGEIVGLLGPNGAGKTTTIRMLATLTTPSRGTATIAGHDIVADPERVRASIGYLTGSAGLYERLTAREVLRYFGALHGMDSQRIAQRIGSLTERLDLGEFLDRRCDKLSTGQKQRVAIARAVLHDPPVLFFDEPTSGLDVLAARTVMRTIREYRAEGKTILFSTHVMSEVEALCDRITVVHRGRVTATGTLDELRNRTGATTFESIFLRLIGEEDAP
ncbi:MAG: ABC transporter ATP-binding protein [Armatimonadota bacterium]